jgi:hypothetical protein
MNYDPMALLSMMGQGGFGGQGGQGDYAPILAMILKSLEQTNAASQQRLAAKSAAFDPSAHYNTGGAPPPYFTGLSAAQRYRDMQMRQAAQAEAARAAVAQRQQEQAEAIQPGTAADLATSNIRRVGGSDAGPTLPALSGPRGEGSVSYVPAPTVMNGVGGGALTELFQRATNSMAGSPNAAALGLSVEPGYYGGGPLVPMGAGDEAGWSSAVNRHNARRRL